LYWCCSPRTLRRVIFSRLGKVLQLLFPRLVDFLPN
jgi:hypothetical protein